jgi:hypothetical protein
METLLAVGVLPQKGDEFFHGLLCFFRELCGSLHDVSELRSLTVL